MNILLILAIVGDSLPVKGNEVTSSCINSWCDLGISTLGSLVGAGIVMVVTYFWKLRRFLRIKFQNQKSAEKSIIKDISNSKELRVYAMCGSTFSDKVNSKIAEKALDDSNLKQLYLISAENNPSINIRQEELPKGASSLLTRITTSIKQFNDAKTTNPKIEIKQHKELVRFRLIILDNCLYLSQQKEKKYGKDAEMQRITKDMPAYKNYLYYFNKKWEQY